LEKKNNDEEGDGNSSASGIVHVARHPIDQEMETSPLKTKAQRKISWGPSPTKEAQHESIKILARKQQKGGVPKKDDMKEARGGKRRTTSTSVVWVKKVSDDEGSYLSITLEKEEEREVMG